MVWLIGKYLISAALIVLITEVAKRSDKVGGLITALPIMTILTLIWLYLDQQPLEKIGNYSRYTFWYVIPTLPMFLILPYLLPRFGFWTSLAICILITLLCFILFALVMRRYGINLW
ncbi:MAG TPA: DUF3147 family protein [Pseudomonadales bacterium]|nr:DUF3147 family protein [Pseudomonadales bacterium]